VHEKLDHEHAPSNSAPDFEPWDEADLIRSVHETIDWLHRLSNLVRKAGVANQNERAAAFELEDEMGNDMTENLRCFYKALIKRDCKELNEYLVDRLAHTMILRRKRILYRRTRPRRWILQEPEETRGKLDVLPVLSTNQSQDRGTSQEEEEIASDYEPSANNKDRGALSMLTATTGDRKRHLQQVIQSQISRATSAPFQPGEKLLVPPPPKAAERGNEFVCDYCCLILSSDRASDRDKWV
jgi:hypothetical protein